MRLRQDFQVNELNLVRFLVHQQVLFARATGKAHVAQFRDAVAVLIEAHIEVVIVHQLVRAVGFVGIGHGIAAFVAFVIVVLIADRQTEDQILVVAHRHQVRPAHLRLAARQCAVIQRHRVRVDEEPLTGHGCGADIALLHHALDLQVMHRHRHHRRAGDRHPVRPHLRWHFHHFLTLGMFQNLDVLGIHQLGKGVIRQAGVAGHLGLGLFLEIHVQDAIAQQQRVVNGVLNRPVSIAFRQNDVVDVIGRLFRALFVAFVHRLVFGDHLIAENGANDRRQHLLDDRPHVAGHDLRLALVGRRVAHHPLVILDRADAVFRHVVRVLFSLMDHLRDG